MSSFNKIPLVQLISSVRALQSPCAIYLVSEDSLYHSYNPSNNTASFKHYLEGMPLQNGTINLDDVDVALQFKIYQAVYNQSNIKSKKSYYHLQHSEDGRFNQSSTIAWIESDTTKEERIKLADHYTNGQFTKYPGFYQLIGPIETPSILSL